MSFALTIDLEDWRQSVLNRNLPLSDQFITQTWRLLEILAEARARATFFVLGLAAHKSPALIREIASLGHEIQSHGWDHRPITQLSREEFGRDLRRSRGVLEDAAGIAVTGYRAPRFSIDASNLWAFETLAEAGFTYDSSIFPLRVRGYGIGRWPTGVHRIILPNGATLIEAPVACGRWFGRRVPIGGGGYWRLLPWAILRQQLHSCERQRLNQRPTTWRSEKGDPDGALHRSAPSAFAGAIYLHPYEIDHRALARESVRIPWRTRIHQGLGRRGFESKLRAFLGEFRVSRMDEAIANSLGDFPFSSAKGRPKESMLPR